VPDSERPIVDVRIGSDSEERRFIVDTAATQTVVDRAYAADRHLLTGQSLDVQGATGGAAFRVAIVDRLAAGAVTARNLPVVVADLARYRGARAYPITGVLGSDMSGAAGALFDGPRRRFTIGGAFPERGCLPNHAPPDLHGLTIVDAKVGRGGLAARVEAVVDTGAPQSILNLAALGALQLTTTSPEVRHSRSVTKGFSTAASGEQTWLLSIGAVRLGRFASAPFEARVSDAPIFRTLGLADQPAIILGWDVLQNTPFAVTPGLRSFCIQRAAQLGLPSRR
jgi:predicted aspartyl protease